MDIEIISMYESIWSHGDDQVVPTICDEVVIPYTSANNGKDSNFDHGRKLDDGDTDAESNDESVDMHVQLSMGFLKHLSNNKENITYSSYFLHAWVINFRRRKFNRGCMKHLECGRNSLLID